ncbi:hypothetical protein RJT34_17711 [Clitoria ternatea]|uniref:Uncharacterized protein n=1 Tax=Clitoria ternatea TaxID=43366 RepID=A0AAN9PER6_CLITE
MTVERANQPDTEVVDPPSPPRTMRNGNGVIQGNQPVADPVPVPILKPVPISNKGSCEGVDPDGHNTGADLGRRYQLLLDGVPDPVAIGMVK